MITFHSYNKRVTHDGLKADICTFAGYVYLGRVMAHLAHYDYYDERWDASVLVSKLRSKLYHEMLETADGLVFERDSNLLDLCVRTLRN